MCITSIQENYISKIATRQQQLQLLEKRCWERILGFSFAVIPEKPLQLQQDLWMYSTRVVFLVERKEKVLAKTVFCCCYRRVLCWFNSDSRR